MEMDLSKIGVMMDNINDFISHEIKTKHPVICTGKISESGFQFGFLVSDEDKSELLRDILGTLVSYSKHVLKSIELASELKDMIAMQNGTENAELCTDQAN